MTSALELTDEGLLRRMIAGDEEAFALLYRRRHPAIYRFALHMSGNAAMAEDVTQEVFMALIRDPRRFEPARGTLGGFLFGIARNHLRKRWEQDRRIVLFADFADGSGDVASGGFRSGAVGSVNGTYGGANGHNLPSAARDEYASLEEIKRVRQAVATLPGKYRVVVVLCELEEMSYEEAASALCCPVGTIRSRLHRARAVMVEKLREAPVARGGRMNEEEIGMDCARFEEILHDLARRGIQGLSLRRSAIAHAEWCGRCARLLMEAESLHVGLRLLADREAQRQASPRVEAALLEEFRRRKAIPSLHRSQRLVAALGIAAILFLTLWLPLRHGLGPGLSLAPARESAGNPPLSPAPATRNVAAAIAGPRAAQLMAQQQRADGSSAENAGNATDFIALPYADDPEGSEGGAVVRVTMQRSALASLGISSPELGSGEPVLADLVVTQDGTPQAIRLVSQGSADQSF